MFVLKNIDDGSYFGIVSDGDFKGSYRWLNDLEDKKIKIFETKKEASRYIKDKLIAPFYEEKTPLITEVKVATTTKYYEATDPDVFNVYNGLVEQVLNIHGHKDAISALLADESLVHDTNACIGRINRSLETAGLKFSNKEAYEYSDIVGNLVYRDKNGNWRPTSENRSELLSFRARRAAEAFATMADGFALIEKYKEMANRSKQ